jgi:hypothetical protein
MANIRIYQILKSDLMSGNSEYVKDSYLIFNHLAINVKKDMVTIKFIYNGNLLASIERESYFLPHIDFKLEDGQMKIELI